ncbi:MAG: class I SAM-dependent methyltransferase, partial [Anaerolineales bacterium]|nr:class I SAM-dependent methyltransferase [Anaerolineales bacterium]
HILDVGCGSGRHAVELAQRGYRVTGIDISIGMLREAQRRAEEVGVLSMWVQADASVMHLAQQADGVICLCEGAFGLLGSADDPHTHELAILAGIYAALKPGGKFILTALNGMAKIRRATAERIEQGTFDPMALTEVFTLDYESNGDKKSVVVRERGFVPSELRLMLTTSGFDVVNIYGGTAGAWSRNPPRLDEIELMAIAIRPLGDA